MAISIELERRESRGKNERGKEMAEKLFIVDDYSNLDGKLENAIQAILSRCLVAGIYRLYLQSVSVIMTYLNFFNGICRFGWLS